MIKQNSLENISATLHCRYPITAISILSILCLLLTGCWSDNTENIAKTQKRLKTIFQALKTFQSENYFGHPPENLAELNHYEVDMYIPANAFRQNSNENKNEFVNSRQVFSLIPDRRVFLKSGLDEDEENKLIQSSQDLIIDYELLPGYKMFLPDNAVIVWDKAGNFSNGGNLLFADGTTRFLNIPAEDYQRFITALKTGTDRQFVRDTCIKNKLSCSLHLLQENHK